MLRDLRARFTLSSGALLALLFVGTSHAAEPKHLDVDAMLRIASIGDPAILGWMGSTLELAHVSRDGKKVALAVQWGQPASDLYAGRILLFDARELADNRVTPRPRVLAEFTSRTNYQPVAALRWVGDDSLIFAATDAEGPMQVYRLDVRDGKTTRLTNETQPIAAFAMSRDTGRLLVLTHAPPPVAPERNPECLKRGCEVTAKRLVHALSGTGERGLYPGDLAVYDAAGRRRRLTSLYDADGIKDCFPNSFIPGGLSPNGRYALFFCKRGSWPDWWAEYTVDPRFTENLRKGNTGYAHQYFLLDLDADRIRPVTTAPFLRFAPPFDPLWIDGGNRLLLAGAVEPLEGTSGAERQRRAGRLGVVSVDPATGRTSFEIALDHRLYRYVPKARWNQDRSVLTLDPVRRDGKAAPSLAWRRQGTKWIPVDPRTGEGRTPPVKLRLVQSPNDRPVLYAGAGGSDQDRAVLDPNPWLDEYKLGAVEEIEWRSSGGHAWDGAVYLPPDYVPGRRYPLVILTHGFNKGEFSPYGVARNFAAQPLAAKGMVVLQMDEKGVNDVVLTPEEFPRSREGIESAIDELDRRGLIDRGRVGLVGWSRTSWYSNYMATHSDYPLKALMMTDGGDIGWWSYMSYGALDLREMEVDLGAAPFGPGLEPMLEIASTFSLDRWRAPILMWSGGELPDLWDVYAGLRRLDVPVEYWLFPDGTHDFFKMSHRRAGGELMVDWFDFWLNGNEDPKAEKANQYRRWRILREKEERVLSTPRPPLLDWSARPAIGPSR